MFPKKTFSSWLTNRYLLILRSEENFSEKATFSFNYARLILVVGGIFFVLLSLATFIVRQWLGSGNIDIKADRQVLELSMRLDSLENELISKDHYVENIRRILTGEVDASVSESTPVSTANYEVEDRIHSVDSQFRAEFESGELAQVEFAVPNLKESLGLENIFLFSPLDGILADGFDPSKDHYGVDLVAQENEPVRAVSDGVVVLSSWTLDGGYVLIIQHKANLTSVYKHNSELFKKVGNFVKSGEVIARIGNTGELTSGTHLHLELWYNGNPLNPVELIAF